MAKRKATDELDHTTKKRNVSNVYVDYTAARRTGHKLTSVSATKIGKRSVYKFFINYNNQYYPLRCMLDLGSTGYVILPNAAKAFKIPVVKGTEKGQSRDVTGRELFTEGIYPIALGFSFANHRSYDPKDHAFEVMETSRD